jgi:rhodanese-related sulfurtransferase
MKFITVNDLQSRTIRLIDVRLSAEFEAAHIADATNNCVFEVAFTDRMTEMVPDKNEPIYVDGLDETSHESRMAADKLQRAGYTNVHDFRGGLTNWEQAGNSVVGSGQSAPPLAKPDDGERAIDTEESLIEWTGRNLGNKHWGALRKCPRIYSIVTQTGDDHPILPSICSMRR